GCAAKFSGKRCSSRAIRIVNGGDVELSILQSARHVHAHASNSNKTDIHVANVRCLMFDFRCSVASSRTCAQQQELQSVRPLPLATAKFCVRKPVWRRELILANTNSR